MVAAAILISSQAHAWLEIAGSHGQRRCNGEAGKTTARHLQLGSSDEARRGCESLPPHATSTAAKVGRVAYMLEMERCWDTPQDKRNGMGPGRC